METLHERVAVVTGGASGIGLALARGFAQEGARVVIADIEYGALDAALRELPEGTLAVHTDVSMIDSVEELAVATLDRFGRVDVVCNNAGVSTFNTLDDQTLEDWRWVLDVNLWGVIHGVTTFLPIMKRQGTPAHIVNTASVAGLLSGVPFLGPYSVSKVGVVSISETLRAELAMAGSPVGVSVVCPSATRTNVMEAERNRPPALAPERRTPEADAWLAAMKAGFSEPTSLEPEVVAALVVDAVLTERFWVISHGDLRDSFERRFAEILAATPNETPNDMPDETGA
jgi:NAD(P)-dependent dehydrogenase (short-subunit alcohol dehydrogenase family)